MAKGNGSEFGRESYSRLLDETQQSSKVRNKVYEKMEALLNGRKVISFFTSFRFPVGIEDADADIIEEVLQNCKLEKGLTLVLNSPGGSGLAAERIIKVCCSHSNRNFEVIVPKMAKSAATMICFGADKIYMGDTSELGPIDPQVPIEGKSQWMSAHNIIQSYEELFLKAENSKGKIEPYLQQLQRYDAREIKEWKSDQKLSESIAINSLKAGMMKGKTATRIRKLIKPFIDPEKTLTHGRPIYSKSAKECGLNIRDMAKDDELWKTVWELYIRVNYVVNHTASKIVESKETHYEVGRPRDPS